MARNARSALVFFYSRHEPTSADRRLALAVRLERLNLFQPCRECRRTNKWDVLPTNFNLNAAAYDFSTASEVWPRFTHINPQLQYSYNTGRCGDGVGPRLCHA